MIQINILDVTTYLWRGKWVRVNYEAQSHIQKQQQQQQQNQQQHQHQHQH